MKQNAILTDIKDAVQNADLVCFDIFDTLITRKVLHPVDAFLLTEELAKARSVWNGDFKNQRIRAEQMAYEQVPGGHVTLKDIYAVISAEQQLSVTQTEEMMNLELESEGLLTVPRTDVREEAVWDRLLNGCLDYSLTLAEDIFASMVVCDLFRRKCFHLCRSITRSMATAGCIITKKPGSGSPIWHPFRSYTLNLGIVCPSNCG